MEPERWKDIKGFEFYEISSHGRVKSKLRMIKRKHPNCNRELIQVVKVGGKIINGWVSKPKENCNYFRRSVALRKNRKTYTMKVHNLVLNAFIGLCPIGMECCHNDGNPLNNYYKNLRWGTHKSNVKDSIRHGTKINPPIHIGETHPAATISDEDVKMIRKIPYYHGLYADLAIKFKVALYTISRIYNFKSRLII